MKITILGCGPSTGVPVVGNNWGQCDPQNPKNHRTRASLLIEYRGKTILIDTSPDIRNQLLRAQCSHIDAVFFTHAHADHTHGINELRTINRIMQRPIPIYGDKATILDIKESFAYIFKSADPYNFYKPSLIPHIIEKNFQFSDISVNTFMQSHGMGGQSLCYRIGNFAYSTDVVDIAEKDLNKLKNLDVWIVDCLQKEPHPTHAHLDKACQWIEKVKPKKAFLTHMNETLDYQWLCDQLPLNIRPSYDTQIINVC